MKIYLAGKITGDPDYRVKFMMARVQLERQGHTVLSPAILPDRLDAPDEWWIKNAMIDVADAVAFLPDWWDCPGAQLDKDHASDTGKVMLWPWGDENHGRTPV